MFYAIFALLSGLFCDAKFVTSTTACKNKVVHQVQQSRPVKVIKTIMTPHEFYVHLGKDVQVLERRKIQIGQETKYLVTVEETRYSSY